MLVLDVWKFRVAQRPREAARCLAHDTPANTNHEDEAHEVGKDTNGGSGSGGRRIGFCERIPPCRARAASSGRPRRNWTGDDYNFNDTLHSNAVPGGSRLFAKGDGAACHRRRFGEARG